MKRNVAGLVSVAVLTVGFSGCGLGADGRSATTATVTETVAAAEPEGTDPVGEEPAESVSEETSESAEASTAADDPDRPEEAMSVGEAGKLGGLEVTVETFQEVAVIDPLEGWTYYGARVAIRNLSDGPAVVMPSAQMRLENIYVATVETSGQELVDGEVLVLDTMRPQSTLSGWVVWAVLDSSDLMESFGIYFEDLEGLGELVWWNNIP